MVSNPSGHTKKLINDDNFGAVPFRSRAVFGHISNTHFVRSLLFPKTIPPPILPRPLFLLLRRRRIQSERKPCFLKLIHFRPRKHKSSAYLPAALRISSIFWRVRSLIENGSPGCSAGKALPDLYLGQISRIHAEKQQIINSTLNSTLNSTPNSTLDT